MILIDIIQITALIVLMKDKIDLIVLMSSMYFLLCAPVIYVAMEERSLWFYYPCLTITLGSLLMAAYTIYKSKLYERDSTSSTKSKKSRISKKSFSSSISVLSKLKK